VKAILSTEPAQVGGDNEDFAGVTPTAAVVLDGAGLSGTQSKCKHGVAWYSATLGGALLGMLGDLSRPLPEILAAAISHTADSHRDTCDLDDPGTPSATVLVVRQEADHLSYLVLADSVLVVDSKVGQPLVVCDDREAVVGARYRAEMDGLANGTQEHAEARQRYVQTLRDHRNRPDGFWVAAASPEAAYQSVTGSVPTKDLLAVALLSDGASRLVDRFKLATWPQALEILAHKGPDELIAQVRTAERADDSGRRWPRGKTYDDATAVYLDFR
jgi:hypothetical protein